MLDLIDLGGKGAGGRTGRIWVLDPVDGTATFMNGQQYAVCLALVEDGKQKIGVLGCPNLNLEKGYIFEDVVDKNGYGLMISAVVGQGATVRPTGRGALAPATPLGKLSSVSSTSELRFVDCLTANSSDSEKHKQLITRLGAPWPPTTNLWSAQMRYIALAVGGCNAMVKIPRKKGYRSNLWDHAGGMLIVEEVGAKITDLDGASVDCGLGRTIAGCYGMVVAPEGIHGKLLEAVQQFLREVDP
jgi:3'(2'), 5'-bisphosphate nucleotidase